MSGGMAIELMCFLCPFGEEFKAPIVSLEAGPPLDALLEHVRDAHPGIDLEQIDDDKICGIRATPIPFRRNAGRPYVPPPKDPKIKGQRPHLMVIDEASDFHE